MGSATRLLTAPLAVGRGQPGRVRFFDYDSAGQLVVDGPAGAETWWVRDAAGRVTSDRWAPVLVERTWGCRRVCSGRHHLAGLTVGLERADGRVELSVQRRDRPGHLTFEDVFVAGGGRVETVTAPAQGPGV